MLNILYNLLEVDMKINGKVLETINFLICLGIIVGIAYYTGFLKEFSLDSLNRAVNTIASDITSKKTSATPKRTKVASTEYKNYKPMYIPPDIIKASYQTSTWTRIFNSDKKIIFYIYSESSDGPLSKDFHYDISNYVYNNSRYYNISPYSENEFNSVRAGDIGPAKICDSIAECNEVRKKAADYSMLAEFFKRCSRTMCIINPQKNQYYMLRSRDSRKAVQTLNDLKGW